MDEISQVIDICGGLEKALSLADWLTDADAAAVALARLLARELSAGEVDSQLVGKYLDSLKSLGLTTVSRKDLGLDKADFDENPLDKFRGKPELRIART